MAIDADGILHAQAATPLPPPLRRGVEVEQDPGIWWQALQNTLRDLFTKISSVAPGILPPATLVRPCTSQQVRAIAVAGTSSTLLLTDDRGEPLGPAFMYNDARSQRAQLLFVK